MAMSDGSDRANNQGLKEEADAVIINLLNPRATVNKVANSHPFGRDRIAGIGSARSERAIETRAVSAEAERRPMILIIP
jgi:hypothetical protein